MRDIDLGGQQGLQDGASTLHLERQSGAMKANLEPACCRRRSPSCEMLDMDPRSRQRRGRRFKSRDHGLRAAAIEVRELGRGRHDCREVQPCPVCFRVEMQSDTSWPEILQMLEFAEKRRRGPVSRRIEKLPAQALAPEPVDHRHQWRDADASRDQDRVLRGLVELEIVPRRIDPDAVADTKLLMDKTRAAAAVRSLHDGNDIAIPLLRIVAQ